MLIKIAQAGVIDDAPKIYDIILNAVNGILIFVSVLTILMIIISGLIYMTSAGGSQTETAKKYLIGSISGLVVVLLSLVIVNVIVGLF